MKRRGNFIFDDFHSGPIAYVLVAFFDRSDAADIQTNACVKFQGFAAGGRFRRTKENTDLFAKLIDKDKACTRAGDNGCQFSQRLLH